MLLPARLTMRIGLLVLAALTLTAAFLVVQAAGAKKGRPGIARITAFHSCDGLVDYAREQALQMAEARRLADSRRVSNPGDVIATPGAPVPLSAPESLARSAPTSEPGIDHSTTNMQEAGIDEPDIVKTDGSHIFAVAGDKLHAVDATGSPRLADSLALNGRDHELLLRGDRLLVISHLHDGMQPETVLAEVDVRNPTALRTVRTLRIEGSFVSSRLNGGTARVVINSHPRALDPPPNPDPPPSPDPLPGPVPVQQGGGESDRGRSAGIGQWLPSYVLRNRRTGRTARHRLVRCRAVRHAPIFSGLDLLTVLTIDLDKGLPAVDSDALMTNADTVYASQRSLYLATEKWLDPLAADQAPPGTTTAIHKFDISEPDRTHYRASGEVPGFVLNQFSLSEHKGFLRVASTEQPTWWRGGGSRQSESFVTVLDERSGKLAEVGRVGGLGRGEQIYSVRFIEDAGFVVTFRQTDPLYTVDLSSPSRPRVLGELKILGYSSYLHPIGKDLLIGVGQDATEQGRTLGTQISLFDVSDLRRPVRLDNLTLARGSSSTVEYEHHAFLYWPPAKLAVLPVTIFGGWGPTWGPQFAGAVAFRISSGSNIAEAGRVSHDKTPNDDRFGSHVRRSLIVGRRLYTVSARGIKASSLETLAELAWVPFG